MNHNLKTYFACALISLSFARCALAGSSFICTEPGGKRVIEVDGANVGLYHQPATYTIDSEGFINDRDGKRVFIVDDHDVRPSPAGVKLAVFDGDDIRHGTGGKVMMNYQHPNLCPTSADNRVYSIEGDALSKQQLVAGLALLKPEMFKLTAEEDAEQKKAMKEAGEESDRLAAADQVAGKWMMLNSSGVMEKLGSGEIVVSPKAGDAYPITLDFTKAGGPQWTGVGHYEVMRGDKCFWVAYGTPKTIALAVYEIDGATLKGKWYPWYIDGNAKNVGTETLTGKAAFGGEYKIASAAAPSTGAAYTGTVMITPLKIVGAVDSAAPYSLTWSFGATKVKGIGIRSGKYLFVASGTGADVNIAKFTIQNGSMTSDWFKLGSTEKGSNAATSMN